MSYKNYCGCVVNIKKDYDSYTYITYRICKDYVIKHIIPIIITIILMTVNSASVALRTYIIKPAVDKIFVNKDLVALYKIPVKLIVISIVVAFSMYFQSLILDRVNSKISTKLETDLFNKLIEKDIHFFKTRSSATITALFGNMSGITAIIDKILNGLFSQFFTLCFLIGTLFYQNWKMTLIAFIAFPLLLIPLKHIGKQMKKLMENNNNKQIAFSGVMGELFDNIVIIKSSCSEEVEKKNVKNRIEYIYKIKRMILKKSLLVSPLTEMVGTIGFSLVILYGGIRVIKANSTAGDFFMFIASLLSAYKPAKSFSGIGVQLQNAFILSKRYFTLLDSTNVITEGKISPNKIIGDIKFNNVDFYYPLNDESTKFDKQVLFNINLDIKHNHSYALVGHSGSGKSTIFNLILRFYDATKGSITLDGIDLKDLTFSALRKNISLVSQDIKLFNNSIYNNILYERADATKEEVLQAAKLASVDEFVNKLDNGYDTIIGPNGSLLSGGQKQRISIARAFLKNSPILLLDEATSALDPISEDLIKKSIAELMVNKTTIIIAHRLSTIVNCDHIFVFESGKLIEEGTHSELLANKSVYEDLYNKQFAISTETTDKQL